MPRVYGWVLDEEKVIDWGIKKGIGTREGPQDSLIIRSVVALASKAGLSYNVRLEAITIDSMVEICISLASDDPTESYQLPNDEGKIEELKKALGEEKGPEWYQKA